MSSVHLAQVDLNLLVVLDVLLSERSTTRAARRLGRTQSAISHSLRRLRDLFGDRLFVRAGAALEPTARALELAAPLRSLLAGVDGLVLGARPEFEPATFRRRLSVAATDLFGAAVVPVLVARLRKVAPFVDLDVRATEATSMESLLLSRELDAAFGTRFQGSGIHTLPVGEEDMVAVLRRGHPASKRRLDLDAYCALGHVLVAPRGNPGSAVDEALAPLGRTRRVAVRVPHFVSAILIASRTDLITTLPRSFARSLSGLGRFVVRELPFPSPVFGFHVAVAKSREGDPAIAWLAEELVAACREGLRVRTKGVTA
jgi:DNA-binding transcriptional LysR family regulator